MGRLLYGGSEGDAAGATPDTSRKGKESLASGLESGAHLELTPSRRACPWAASGTSAANGFLSAGRTPMQTWHRKGEKGEEGG